MAAPRLSLPGLSTPCTWVEAWDSQGPDLPYVRPTGLVPGQPVPPDQLHSVHSPFGASFGWERTTEPAGSPRGACGQAWLSPVRDVTE